MEKQTLYYVIALVEDEQANKYLGDGDIVDSLDDPNILVFEDLTKARQRAHRWQNGTIRAQVIRVHHDYLDVAAVPEGES